MYYGRKVGSWTGKLCQDCERPPEHQVKELALSLVNGSFTEGFYLAMSPQCLELYPAHRKYSANIY